MTLLLAFTLWMVPFFIGTVFGVVWGIAIEKTYRGEVNKNVC